LRENPSNPQKSATIAMHHATLLLKIIQTYFGND